MDSRSMGGSVKDIIDRIDREVEEKCARDQARIDQGIANSRKRREELDKTADETLDFFAKMQESLDRLEAEQAATKVTGLPIGNHGFLGAGNRRSSISSDSSSDGSTPPSPDRKPPSPAGIR